MQAGNGRVLSYDYGVSSGIDDCIGRIAAIVDSDAASTHLSDYAYIGRNVFAVVDYEQPEIKWTLADLSGSNDPETGYIYSGCDRFGRLKDVRWYDYGSSEDSVRVKYGYNRDSNRTYRQDVVADANSKPFDQLFGYDRIGRLTQTSQGTLTASRDEITNLSLAKCWTIDATRNWQKYKEDSNGSGSWNIDQTRLSDEVNQITQITDTVTTAWSTPTYSPEGAMVSIPKPKDLTNSFNVTWDAWGRMAEIKDGTDIVTSYEYDAMNRRIVKKSYDGGSLSETRFVFHSKSWQVLEERVGASSNAERQFIWGKGYVDQLVLRDRDSDGSGTLGERLYSLQDGSWNVTALVDSAGLVKERFAYNPYGQSRPLNADYTDYTGSDRDWEYQFTGRELDRISGLYYFRNRYYHSQCGAFCSRDPLEYVDGSNLYSAYFAPSGVDPSGMEELVHRKHLRYLTERFTRTQDQYTNSGNPPKYGFEHDECVASFTFNRSTSTQSRKKIWDIYEYSNPNDLARLQNELNQLNQELHNTGQTCTLLTSGLVLTVASCAIHTAICNFAPNPYACGMAVRSCWAAGVATLLVLACEYKRGRLDNQANALQRQIDLGIGIQKLKGRELIDDAQSAWSPFAPNGQKVITKKVNSLYCYCPRAAEYLWGEVTARPDWINPPTGWQKIE